MKVNATTRSKKGTSASRRLRRAGRVPAILYGAEQEAVSLEIDHNELFHSLRNDDFHASILDMFLDGKKQQVLLRTVQWHPYKPTVLHADFQRVRARSEEHTSELQSRGHLVCRLLLEKKKGQKRTIRRTI